MQRARNLKRVAKFAFVLLLAACSLLEESTPTDLENACSIFRQKPGWERDLRRAERKWGVPASVQMAIIWQESKFVSRAKPPREYFLGIIPTGRVTSAYGYAQVIDSTWDEYRDANNRWFASRDDFGDATDFIGWYLDRSERILGIRKTNVRENYLAYHEGHAGYRRGNHRSKQWLISVANDLVPRERKYARQLRSC
ncbi:MAG: transglycosylase SLT domain-containing protein [Albidovulum sp.]|nr:transglycosylase SLT domain-containing protein [Albidovulum sp.]